jgi:hypothetical protein
VDDGRAVIAKRVHINGVAGRAVSHSPLALPVCLGDNLLMSTNVWVPLVAAGIGLIAGVASSLTTTFLTRSLGRQDRFEQWHREDELRWQRDRFQAYAQLRSALAAWDEEIHPAVRWWKTAAAGDHFAFDADQWDRLRRAARDKWAQVDLVASKEVEKLSLRPYVTRARIAHHLTAENPDIRKLDATSSDMYQATEKLVQAMRKDLGLGGEETPTAGDVETSAATGLE